MLLCVGCLTAPQGPVRHWWDWLRGRLFLPLVFGEDGKGRDSVERDGHWDIAQSCSVVGRSSGSHSLAFTSWSLKLTHSTCRVVFPWPHVTEHWKHTNTVDKEIGHEYKCICSYAFSQSNTHTNTHLKKVLDAIAMMWGKDLRKGESFIGSVIGINGSIWAFRTGSLNCVLYMVWQGWTWITVATKALMRLPWLLAFWSINSTLQGTE